MHARRKDASARWPRAVAAAALAAAGLGALSLLATRPAAAPHSGRAPLAETGVAEITAADACDVPRPGPQSGPEPLVPAALPIAGAAASIRPGLRSPVPGTERAWREIYRQQLREPGADGDALLQAALEAGGPDARTVGLLRALLDTGAANADRALADAALRAPERAGPSSAGIPEFCLRTLAGRAGREPEARAALVRLAAAHDLAPRLRRAAAALLALTDTPGEQTLLADLIPVEAVAEPLDESP